MNRPALALRLTNDSKLPLFVQIARALAEDIRRGVLRGGSRLPGSRRIAESLLVNRNTVLAALAELEQEGWVETRSRQGTFVVQDRCEPLMPARAMAKARKSQPDRPAQAPVHIALPQEQFPDVRLEVPPGALPLIGGMPDMRLLRKNEIARAHRRALLSNVNSLAYGCAWGHPHLRRALAGFLAETRAIATVAENVLITRGSQMSLYLAGQALCGPGARIGVEECGYAPAWQALRMAGATLVPLALDEHGLSITALRKACKQGPLTALYLTPHHQYPTTVTLTARRRQELLALAREHRFAILEDDYDHEQHYAGRPVLPLASEAPDVVLYVGTFSKVLAPGLRLGYTVGPRHVLERMMQLRTYIDRQGDMPMEQALAEMIEDGELQRHTRRITRHSHERRDALVQSLTAHLGAELQFRIPPGGMALWAKASFSTEAWARRALKRGVFVQAGRFFRYDSEPSQYLRLGFGALNPEEIELAVQRLASARLP